MIKLEIESIIKHLHPGILCEFIFNDNSKELFLVIRIDKETSGDIYYVFYSLKVNKIIHYYEFPNFVKQFYIKKIKII